MIAHKMLTLAGAALLVAVLPAFAQSLKVVQQATDWTTYAHDDPSAKTCFAVSRPKEQEPKGVRRGPAYLYVSAWPNDGVEGEVSIRVGYPLKRGSDATANVGTASFKLFTTEDRAYVEDPAEETRLVEAMKLGAQMTVTAQSERGTVTTDTYSLMGLTQALQALAQTCSTGG